MPAYISMLRGINVSGQKLIKMDALKNLYESLDFEEAITYVQSGNVVFRTEECDIKLLAQKLSVKIKEVYEFDVEVIVKTVNEFKLIIDKNPLVKDSEQWKTHPKTILLQFHHWPKIRPFQPRNH